MPTPAPTPSPTDGPDPTSERGIAAVTDLQGQPTTAVLDVLADVRIDRIELLDRPLAANFNRIELFRRLAQGDIENAIPLIEETLSGEFTEALGLEPQPDYPSLPEIQTRLQTLASETGTVPTVLYVMLRPNSLDLIAIPTRGGPIYRSIPIESSDAVLNAKLQLLEGLLNPRLRRRDSYREPARQLYEWLVTPILPELERLGTTTLVLALDRGLRGIPLAALWNGEQFLVEQFDLALIPSLNLVDTRYRSVRDANVLALGASTFADQIPLPAVPLEVGIVMDIFSGRGFLDADFTFENLRRQREREPVPLIHLATHGEFTSASADRAYIQFADERVGFDRIRSLDWNDPPVELVVLSACRTAVGSDEAELGFAGFTVQSGAKTALASLWYVSDLGTLGLMSEFYYHLKTAPIKAEALQRTQLAVLRGDVRVENGQLIYSGGSIDLPSDVAPPQDLDFVHPYFWASFTIVGSPW